MSQDTEFIVVVTEKQWLEENKNLQNINSIKDALGDVILFLWAASRNLIPASLYAILSKKEIVTWSKKLHSISILPNDPHKDRTTYESTGDLSVVAETMVRLRTALENQLDYKKKEKEESKNR